MPPRKYQIRPARSEDCPPLADLCTQLGYPSTPEQLTSRLRQIQADPDHAVFIAEENSAVIGWVHVHITPLLESDRTAEIGGLVIDEKKRGLGIGRALMEQAEAWANQHSCREIRLRSNILREAAHRFYEALGYKNLKTSYTFRKQL